METPDVEPASEDGAREDVAGAADKPASGAPEVAPTSRVKRAAPKARQAPVEGLVLQMKAGSERQEKIVAILKKQGWAL